MREIKFRAWDKNNKKMMVDTNLVYPALSLSGTLIAYKGDEKIPNFIAEQRFILMQYTGLKDKNGKEIFEGDIVDVPSFNPSRYEVVFDRGGFCMRHDKDDFHYPDGKYLEDGEVIGNIHENPELLTT